MKPIRSSLPSSSWLVATVVPWLTAVTASPDRPIRSRTLRTPLRKPSAGSAGVDGVFVVVVWPVSSSTATTSVNVPPVSMPMRTRRAVMAGTLAVRYRGGKGCGACGSRVLGGTRIPPEPGDAVDPEAVGAGARGLALPVDPAGVILPRRLLAHAERAGDRRPGRARCPGRPDGELLPVPGLAGDDLAEREQLEHLPGRQALPLGDLGGAAVGGVGEELARPEFLVPGHRRAQGVLTPPTAAPPRSPRGSACPPGGEVGRGPG